MMPREPSCEEVMARLFDYLDRELEAPDRAVIERHLARCHACFGRVEFERRLRARLDEAMASRAPPRLRRRLERLLDELESSHPDS
ncbi:anti-sigma factor family protein [Halomonas sp. 328]|uniref:anti-sigma factor family protein n=1 Tax=Halomonas sp. 328 TaxID=2776704 RepID=UPI0018A71B64|nr:zf-HC2 domain-containing protein [Halomonas sp. 328]MBF8223099.1 zf-HC2 domain-containing protein [Halomonas sp. 328]